MQLAGRSERRQGRPRVHARRMQCVQGGRDGQHQETVEARSELAVEERERLRAIERVLGKQIRLERAPQIDLLRSLFDLTPAEGRVAQGLATGLTLEEIAEAGGVSSNTVRNQLRKVLEKTGCTRQAEVAALLANVAIAASA